ncbi:MAG TPA: hypothetical protein VF223_28000 [Trebonia sp.]
MEGNTPAVTDKGQRANRHGSKCPDWCQIDHATPNMHTGRVIDIHMSAAVASGDVEPRVILSQFSSEHGNRAPEVQVAGVSVPGYVFTSRGMAVHLADLIQSLADCTPQRLRDLADEIRVAASVLR